MSNKITSCVQSVIDHINELAVERDLTGNDIRTIAAVTLCVYGKASGIDLDEIKRGLDLFWDKSEFTVPIGGES